MRVARVTVEDTGEWVLTVAGTDIREVLYKERHLELDPFPGNAMGHRLIELGWMPDRRASFSSRTMSTVDRLYLTAMAGWMLDREKSWTIPCYPRD